jgi:hypothetical protein
MICGIDVQPPHPARPNQPMIWCWLLVTDATTIAELHAIIQIAFGWSDSHLHQFVMRPFQTGGKPYHTLTALLFTRTHQNPVSCCYPDRALARVF